MEIIVFILIFIVSRKIIIEILTQLLIKKINNESNIRK